MEPINPEETKTVDEKLYQIACTFPVLRLLGVSEGKIPGITPTCFQDRQLSDFLYDQEGKYLSEGESLILEYLLNLYMPYRYQAFNLGRAMQVWDEGQLTALRQTTFNIYQGECPRLF